MRILKKLKWYFIWLLLSRKECSLLSSTVTTTKEYAINHYAEGMGETYHEFIEVILQFPDLKPVKWEFIRGTGYMNLYQEWLDHTQLINGKTLIWYFDADNDCIKSVII